MTDKLKPCPFCGSDDVEVFGPYGLWRRYGITHSCFTFRNGTQDMISGFPSEEQAALAWNTRPQ